MKTGTADLVVDGVRCEVPVAEWLPNFRQWWVYKDGKWQVTVGCSPEFFKKFMVEFRKMQGISKEAEEADAVSQLRI